MVNFISRRRARAQVLEFCETRWKPTRVGNGARQREEHDPANQHCGGSGIERRRRAKPVIAVKDSSLLHSLSPPTFNLATASTMTTTRTTTTRTTSTSTSTTTMTTKTKTKPTTRTALVHYMHTFLFPLLSFFSLLFSPLSNEATPKSRTAPSPVSLFSRARTNGEKVRKTR